ncbi:MAG: YlxR family protein [Candidatus Nanopelagicales bacterium]
MAPGPLDTTAARPVRMCVGCRTRAQQGDLLRVVAVAGRLLPDPRRQRSGRGAYVHPTGECVEAAIARKAFGRALRTGGPLETAALLSFVTESNVEERRDAHPMNSQK